ncbi:MAG: hypothetical protein JW889_04660, partial [Verrucomicrobia bacterium]|nr:hypothetical protein [Verrucomicrobiota bacterium]
GLVFGSVMRSDNRTRAVLAWAICVVATVVAVGLSGASGRVGWPRVWLAVGLIGGWLFGFMLARMHEEKMRGTPGPDWTREMESLPDCAPR